MKKYITIAVFAFILLPSSWQVFDSNSKTLTVHYGKVANSLVCFQGKVEDYNGKCTSPTVINPEYELKQYNLRHGITK